MVLSPAFKRFEVRLAEVNHLRQLCSKYNAIGSRTKIDKAGHARALIRGATVLLSSHIQGYIEDLADHLIERAVADKIAAGNLSDRFRYYAMKRDFEEMRSITDHEKAVKRLRKVNLNRADILTLDGAVTEAIRNTSYKDGFGNPTSDEIAKFLRRFGIDDLKSDLKPILKTSWYISINAVDQIVDRRAKIAHGDHMATLTSKELMAYSQLVRAFCSATDKVANRHFRTLGCKL